MGKHLKPVARDQDPATETYAKFADSLAELASHHDLLLIGPLLPHDGHWWRVLAFAADATGMTTLTVTLGPSIPSLAEQDLMTGCLRRRFADVQTFDSMKAMAIASRDAWPSDRADEFLASAETGPGFRFFSN